MLKFILLCVFLTLVVCWAYHYDDEILEKVSSENNDLCHLSVPKLGLTAKLDLQTHSDPEIVKFGKIIDKHLFEKFLIHTRIYDGRTFDDGFWNEHIISFFQEYHRNVPTVANMILKMFEYDVIYKSLKAVVCK